VASVVNTNFARWSSAPPSWITTSGDSLDATVISSRVRIARNFANASFPHHASESAQKQVLDSAIAALKGTKHLDKSHAFFLETLTPVQRAFLAERHLISRQHTQTDGHKGLIVSAGESVSIMINEEDHIRAACFRAGLDLEDAWEAIERIDDDLSARAPISYASEWGFLTACPTNMGTGLRASCLVHLPALTLTNKIHQILETLPAAGLTVRGFYGEGTTAVGDLFQISNAQTLGRSETQILRDVEKGVRSLASLEAKEARNLLSERLNTQLQDRVFRAYGTLRYARTLEYGECMKLLSWVRLGVRLKLDLSLSIESINNLFFLTQPAHLSVHVVNEKLTAPEAETRATFVREKLKRG
jgi:protein arginine kinase